MATVVDHPSYAKARNELDDLRREFAAYVDKQGGHRGSTERLIDLAASFAWLQRPN